MKSRSAAHVPRFYVDAMLTPKQTISLEGEQAHHLAKVLRAQTGDALVLFNGDGKEYLGEITRAGKSRVDVELQTAEQVQRESALKLTLAQGIARGDRMDQALAKAVELGVYAIQPVFTARGKVRLDSARADKKHQHWQRVVQSAAEQSGRTILPRVYAPCTLNEFLETPPAGLGLVLDPRANQSLGEISQSSEATLLVGPESGLETKEIEQATATGYACVRFGPRILRTETAGPACLAVLQNLWGDLR